MNKSKGSIMKKLFLTFIAMALLTASATAGSAQLRRKESCAMHGPAGMWCMPFFTGQITADESRLVDPRLPPGADRIVVLEFDEAIQSTPFVSAADNAGGVLAVTSVAVLGDLVVIHITVPDAVNMNLSVLNVNGNATDFGAQISYLAGDVYWDQVITQLDVDGIKAHSGETLNELELNFIYDINCNGVINSTDILAAKARLGRSVTFK